MLYLILACLMLSLNAQAVATPIKQPLLSLSDEELVKAAMTGQAGKCSIVAPDSPRRIEICWGAPNVYDQYTNSKPPI
jgi:hypothetical protein